MEYVLIENFFVTLVVLLSMKAILNISVTKRRLFFAALCGSLVALCYPLLKFSRILLFMYKIFSGMIICVCAFKSKGKKFFLLYTTFMLTTFIYGGACLMLQFMIYGDFFAEKNMPLYIVLLLILFVYFFVKQLFVYVNINKKVASFIYNVEIVNKQTKIQAKAYFDSGNVLSHPKTKQPILLASKNIFFKLFGNEAAAHLALGNIKKFNAEYINVATPLGQDKLLVFCVEYLFVSQNNISISKSTNQLFALSKVTLKNLECDVVLNAKMGF